MQYVALVFGLFGLLAYFELSAMKKRITELERALAKMPGSSYAEDRAALARAVRACIGKSVAIDFKEDYQDADIVMYGNTKHGKNTIADADEDWMLVRIESAKGVKDKLIRLESVRNIRISEQTD